MPTPLYADLEQNRKALNKMFGQSTDFYAKPIGHSVSLVSALIIGDAAVGAGILSTPVVIVAALTSLAVFVLPSMYEPLTILRILFVLAAGL